MRPKISATASSVPTLVQPLPASSSIPDTAQVATPRAAAETSTRSTNLINQILLEFGGCWGGESGAVRWRIRVLGWQICGAGVGFPRLRAGVAPKEWGAWATGPRLPG